MPFKFFVILFAFQSCFAQDIDQSIVLVNAGTANRKEIASLIERINQYEPRVVALAFQFSSEQSREIDNILASALNSSRNLVMVTEIDDYTPNQLVHKKIIRCLPKFTRNAKTGFGNLILEDDQLMTLKQFSQKEYVNGTVEYSFALRTAFQYDSLQAKSYMISHRNYEDVDFSQGLHRFKRFSVSDFSSHKVSKQQVQGKIVMIGFLGPGAEDRFRVSMPGSEKLEIVYGLEFQAQIVSQILRE